MSYHSILVQLNAIKSRVLQSAAALAKTKSPRASFSDNLAGLEDRIEKAWARFSPASTSEERSATLETVLGLGGEKRELELNYQATVKEQEATYERHLEDHLKKLSEDLLALISPSIAGSSSWRHRTQELSRATSACPLELVDDVPGPQEPHESLQQIPSSYEPQEIFATQDASQTNRRDELTPLMFDKNDSAENILESTEKLSHAGTIIVAAPYDLESDHTPPLDRTLEDRESSLQDSSSVAEEASKGSDHKF
ncbi:hypothetical protein HRG_010030 [Hirsutella rhossiliensis]|uniref:Uncharacterized protein n=1 Tax=Hirsutella rhossiliensis TaxID=111463 RepID=A0A9P8SF22_9HYPO|nr:uncharacterized protein HRG_10030 [Hirsutella rhossiliensis]KAH0958985.1 hypothetical protein HRG_10030 [Hirsutella rhossiliensis]